jgi:hypothetical protein
VDAPKPRHAAAFEFLDVSFGSWLSAALKAVVTARLHERAACHFK